MFAKLLSTLGLLAAFSIPAQAHYPTDPAANPPLTLKVYNNADPRGFNVSSTIIMGQTEALLVDAQFRQSDAHRIVADLLESGKKTNHGFCQ